MSIKGVDYAWSHPGGAQLAAHGVKFAGRYLSHDATKTLQRSEADDLAAHGISVVVVYEDTANRAADGHAAGVNDAVNAMRMVQGKLPGYTNLDMPAGRPVFFAVDFDAQWSQVSDYLAGAALTIGKKNVGVYGGLDIVTAARSAGYTWLWQASAWSHGQWNPYVQIRQQLATENINGVECDIDLGMTNDYGQWTPGGDMISDQDKQDIANLVVQQLLSAQVACPGDTPPTRSVAAILGYQDLHYGKLADGVAGVAAAVAALKKP